MECDAGMPYIFRWRITKSSRENNTNFRKCNGEQFIQFNLWVHFSIRKSHITQLISYYNCWLAEILYRSHMNFRKLFGERLVEFNFWIHFSGLQCHIIPSIPYTMGSLGAISYLQRLGVNFDWHHFAEYIAKGYIGLYCALKALSEPI